MSNDLDEAERHFRRAAAMCDDTAAGLMHLCRHLRTTPHPPVASPPPPAPPPSLFQSVNGPCAQHGIIMKNGRCPVCSGDVALAPRAAPTVPANEANASNEELCDLFESAWSSAATSINGERNAAARRALYDLGKKHQASADAATVAGLQEKVGSVYERLRQARLEGKLPADGGEALVRDLGASIDMTRPQ